MTSILSILEEIKSDNSRLFKESILKREEHNDLLKLVFHSAYNPLLQFYIRKIPEYTAIESISNAESLELGITQLKYLSDRVYTGHAGIDHLRKILMSLHQDDAKVIELIIGKDLKCGASESTANKVWPKLIPEFPCMLASVYSDKLVSKIKFPAIADLKSDGMRCMAVVKNDVVNYYSRNGKQLDVMGTLDGQLLQLLQDVGTGVVFDGELMVWDLEYYQFLSRKEGNGILNKANKGTITKEEADRICFVIWDYIPLDKFNDGLWDVPYETRRAGLQTCIHNNITDLNKVRFISTQIVKSLDAAKLVFQSYLEQGLEGIILKDPRGFWEDKRSKSLIKFKAELECELIVESVDEGSGKYKGKIGALQCTDSTGKLKVGIGTGLTDEDRDRPFEYYVNNIISVKYNEVIINAKGEMSLFLPVYIEVRHDKTIPDSF